MPESFDTAVILAPGREVLDIFTEYVTACRALGYHHHDLTRLHEWYETEDGLELRTIDAEQRALTAAAQAGADALRLQDKQTRLVGDGWQGSAAMSARDHLARHHVAAEQTVAALHTAAATLSRLREALCEALTRKAAATVEIEGRRAAQRADWLVAARTVAAGVAGDRSAASEVIDQEVRPFVANDIGGDWVTAMRSATAAVADAYADAVAALRSGPMPLFLRLEPIPVASAPAVESVPRSEPRIEPRSEPRFEQTVPAGYTPVESAWPTTPSAAPPSMPAAAPAPPAMPTAPPAVPPVPAAAVSVPEAAMTAPPLPAAGQPSGLPGVGGAVDPGLGAGLNSGVGSGLAGAGQQLADLFSGLVGAAAEGMPDLDAPDPADEFDGPDDPDGLDDTDDRDDTDGDPDDPDEEENPAEEPTDEDAVEPEADDLEVADETPNDEAAAELAEVAAPPEQPPAPIAPPAPVTDAAPLAQPAGETPCEIAADELPQVGS